MAVAHHGRWGERIRLQPRGQHYAGHQHPEVEINWLPNQPGTLWHGGRLHELTSGSLVCYWGGVPHGYSPTGYKAQGNLDLAWITVPMSDLRTWGLDPVFSAGLLAGEVFVLDHRRAVMDDWIDLLQQGAPTERIALLEIAALFLRAQRGQHDPSSARGGGRSQDVVAWLHNHFTEEVRMDDLADRFACHPATLMSGFKKAHGCTIMQYLEQIRLAEAARLLVTTEATVLDIGLQVGFQSQSRFYEAFGRAFGLPPQRYRKEWQLT